MSLIELLTSAGLPRVIGNIILDYRGEEWREKSSFSIAIISAALAKQSVRSLARNTDGSYMMTTREYPNAVFFFRLQEAYQPSWYNFPWTVGCLHRDRIVCYSSDRRHLVIYNDENVILKYIPLERSYPLSLLALERDTLPILAKHVSGSTLLEWDKHCVKLPHLLSLALDEKNVVGVGHNELYILDRKTGDRHTEPLYVRTRAARVFLHRGYIYLYLRRSKPLLQVYTRKGKCLLHEQVAGRLVSVCDGESFFCRGGNLHRWSFGYIGIFAAE